MCKNVVPLNVSPKAPTFAYPGIKPVNQSFVTQTDGIIPFAQQNSRHPLLKTASYLMSSAGGMSG